MNDHSHEPKALFLSPDGNIYPDTLICSGVIPPELGGNPCPFSQSGCMPDLAHLNADDPTYTIDKGQPGDLCPPCARVMANSSFLKNYCRYVYSSVVNGSGWSYPGFTMLNQPDSRQTVRGHRTRRSDVLLPT
jgi:hypothetical protein